LGFPLDRKEGLDYDGGLLFLGSSVVEQLTVNQLVTSSNLVRGAKHKTPVLQNTGFFFIALDKNTLYNYNHLVMIKIFSDNNLGVNDERFK
jgi:hypothetical protein